ncbi:AlteRNAtive oxidase protein [Rutstroemia sp. NJR-2017a BVV2]|nr:AlteRNAtive oxidase protein [Rutstroemia sp. NJR-2017a BVV2]
MLTKHHTFFIAVLAGLWLLYYFRGSELLHLQHGDQLPSPSVHDLESPFDSAAIDQGNYGTAPEMTDVGESEGLGDSSPDLGEHEYKGSGHQGAQIAGWEGEVKDQEEYPESSGHVSDEGAKSAGGTDKQKPNGGKPGLQESKPGNEHNAGTSNENITHDTPHNTAKTLKALCSETNWKEGLWLQCHSWCGANETSICGGLNNARNRIQTCLRLAIDAGSGLILPTVSTQRHFDNPLAFGGASVCPDVYWDVDFLEKAVKKECPQLPLRRCGDMQGIHDVIQGPRRQYMEPNFNKGTFRAFMESTLVEKKMGQVSAKHPVAIGYGDTYIAYNYTAADEMSIRKDLFNTLKFNSELLAIGSSILHSPQLQDGFIGVHLRGEMDWPGSFGTKDQQMDFFTQEIEQTKGRLKTVYVSCGSTGAIQAFRERLEPLGYSVHDKWSLVAGQPIISDKLKDMEFDLAAIVEYQVLLEAKLFLGVWMSTLSLLIAFARSANDGEDFYSTHIIPGSSRNGAHREWDDAPATKGDKTTKLLVVNEFDVMDAFP